MHVHASRSRRFHDFFSLSWPIFGEMQPRAVAFTYSMVRTHIFYVRSTQEPEDPIVRARVRAA